MLVTLTVSLVCIIRMGQILIVSIYWFIIYPKISFNPWGRQNKMVSILCKNMSLHIFWFSTTLTINTLSFHRLSWPILNFLCAYNYTQTCFLYDLNIYYKLSHFFFDTALILHEVGSTLRRSRPLISLLNENMDWV